MSDTQQQNTNLQSVCVFVALTAAVLPTLYAFTMNNTTFATNDYTCLIIQTLVCASSAIALVAAAWRRMPRMGRAIAILLVLVYLWTLFDAGGRRSPTVRGW